MLGDKAVQNSIGKSTFLLVVDFCFGGDDYINPKICKAKDKLHSHIINFAFKFGVARHAKSEKCKNPK